MSAFGFLKKVVIGGAIGLTVVFPVVIPLIAAIGVIGGVVAANVLAAPDFFGAAIVGGHGLIKRRHYSLTPERPNWFVRWFFPILPRRAIGDCMAPAIYDGNIIAIDPQATIRAGDLIVLNSSCPKGLYCKRYLSHDDEGIDFECDKPAKTLFAPWRDIIAVRKISFVVPRGSVFGEWLGFIRRTFHR